MKYRDTFSIRKQEKPTSTDFDCELRESEQDRKQERSLQEKEIQRQRKTGERAATQVARSACCELGYTALAVRQQTQTQHGFKGEGEEREAESSDRRRMHNTIRNMIKRPTRTGMVNQVRLSEGDKDWINGMLDECETKPDALDDEDEEWLEEVSGAISARDMELRGELRCALSDFDALPLQS
eukprot:2419243-Rhodomonas_salina.2